MKLHYDADGGCGDGGHENLWKHIIAMTLKMQLWKHASGSCLKAHVRNWHAPGCSGKHISVKVHHILTLRKSVAPTLHGDQNSGFAAKHWKRTDSGQHQEQQYYCRGVAKIDLEPFATVRCKVQPADFCDTSNGFWPFFKNQWKQHFSRYDEKCGILISMLGQNGASQNRVKHSNPQSTAEQPRESKKWGSQGVPKRCQNAPKAAYASKTNGKAPLLCLFEVPQGRICL